MVYLNVSELPVGANSGSRVRALLQLSLVQIQRKKNLDFSTKTEELFLYGKRRSWSISTKVLAVSDQTNDCIICSLWKTPISLQYFNKIKTNWLTLADVVQCPDVCYNRCVL